MDITVTATRSFVDAASDETETKVLAYPNPVDDILYIKPSKSPIKQVMLFDLSGKLVLTKSVSEIEKGIPVQHLAPSIYILKVETADGTSWTQRISKK